MPIRRIPPATEVGGGSPSDDYVVGYCKPPKHSQFKPGQSGNSRGRPKGARGLKTIVRELMTAKVAVRTATGARKMTRIEAVLQKTNELAMKGNPRAQAELIKLYSTAVPDVPAQSLAPSSEDLTQTDLAILEEVKAEWLAQAREKS